MRRREKHLTTGQITAYCHVSHVTVLKWIRECKLKTYTIPSGHYRVQKSDFREFLVEHKMPVDEAFFGEQATKVLAVDNKAETLEFVTAALSESAGDYEFATEASQKDEVDEALASGADDHLARPLQIEELRYKVCLSR
jgi:two-component system response regulator VicR